MKIACLGNMNNNFFALARYLRDRGYDAYVLLFDDELSHFQPANDSFDLSFQAYTVQLSWGSVNGFQNVAAERIREDLRGYDYIIGCGTAPAYLEKAGLALDLLVPYGKDLYIYPFSAFAFGNPKQFLKYARFSAYQRRGIRRAACLNIDSTNDELESVIRRIGIRGNRLLAGLPMVYTPTFNPVDIRQGYDRSHWFREFEKIRKGHDLMVFHQTRHIWKNIPDRFSCKRNDKLIRGFADFVKKSKGTRAALVTVEFGPDVSESKKLIRELGIEDNVFWFPQMSRKDLMIGLNLADIGTGEFHMSWLSCGTIYEALAMAKPLMHYREDDLYREDYPELYPMINIQDWQDISRTLEEYVKDPEPFKLMGEQGRLWFQKYVVDRSIAAYDGLLNSEASGRKKCELEPARG